MIISFDGIVNWYLRTVDPLVLKCPMWLFSSDAHEFGLHPQVRVFNEVAPQYRGYKILYVSLDTHLTSGPRVRSSIVIFNTDILDSK